MSSDVHASARLFRALSHPARLTILRLAWTQGLSGEHLARLLSLSPATVSQHLSQLNEVGLLDIQQDGHQKLFRANAGALQRTLAALVRGETQTSPAADLGPDPYKERVLRAFLRDGKLVQIPAQRKKRDVVLEYLGTLFEPGRDYAEAEVNQILGEYHPDFFTLRRELVGLGVLERAGGIYHKPAPATLEP